MDRVRDIVNNRDYKHYLDLIEDAELERIYCCHGYQHAISVARLTYMQALEDPDDFPGKDKELIYAAGLLHDIGRWVEYATGEDHAQASARLAQPILEASGFNQSEISLITAAIREHRVPGNAKFGRLLARADDLSRDCYSCKSKNTCYKVKTMLQIHRAFEL